MNGVASACACGGPYSQPFSTPRCHILLHPYRASSRHVSRDVLNTSNQLRAIVASLGRHHSCSAEWQSGRVAAWQKVHIHRSRRLTPRCRCFCQYCENVSTVKKITHTHTHTHTHTTMWDTLCGVACSCDNHGNSLTV